MKRRKEIMLEKKLDVVSIQLVKEGSIPYELAGVEKKCISNPEEAVKIASSFFDSVDREKLVCICLSGCGEPVNISLVAMGAMADCHVSIPDLLKNAILCNAPGFILLHNHPSGNPNPSEEDYEITRRVENACKLIGLKLYDHIVVGEDGGYVSIKETLKG